MFGVGGKSGVASLVGGHAVSEEERQLLSVLSVGGDGSVAGDGALYMGDARLNSLAALTWNSNVCGLLFEHLERGLDASRSAPHVLRNSLLVLQTVVLYGSALAVDKAIDFCRFAYQLQEYIVRRPK